MGGVALETKERRRSHSNPRLFRGVRGGKVGPMARPPVLSTADLDAWLSVHSGWTHEGHELVRAYSFADFSEALAFVVQVGLFAERTDHHPEISLGWGKAKLRFSTHEPAGLTQLDLDGAEAADKAHRTRKSHE